MMGGETYIFAAHAALGVKSLADVVTAREATSRSISARRAPARSASSWWISSA